MNDCEVLESKHLQFILTIKVPPPPPPYAPTKQVRHGPPNLSNIPINVLYRIATLTLDQKATPSRFMGDAEEERIRRIFQLFYGLRGVDRRFYLGGSFSYLVDDRC